MTLNPLNVKGGKVRKRRYGETEQTLERLEKHLYRRQYQTVGGDWSTIFYARFTDWTGNGESSLSDPI